MYSLDEDDSVVHTNVNSPRMSKPASPTSQQLFLTQPPSTQQLHDLSVDSLARVTLGQSNSSGNHIATFANAQKTSVEMHDGPEAESEQPLLKRSSNS